MHDPFNHPTVVYRRSAVLAAGGYGALKLMEDYALFARMLQTGAGAVNVAEPLVYYRVGETAFKRRGGTDLLRSELRLQREFRKNGFTTPAQYVRNVLVRGGYRLIPWWVRRAVYRPILSRGRAARQPSPPDPAAGGSAGRRDGEATGARPPAGPRPPGRRRLPPPPCSAPRS